MIKILIKFGKRVNYYGKVNKKYPTIFVVRDINSVDELMYGLNTTIYLVNSKGNNISGCLTTKGCRILCYNKEISSNEDLSIAMDYINADQYNILTFLNDLKEKNFIDYYKFIYDIDDIEK